MSDWKTAAEIAERYHVGEQTLLSYSQRGNLPFRRREDGALVFKETVATRFFRPRLTSEAGDAPASIAPSSLGGFALGSVLGGGAPYAGNETEPVSSRRPSSVNLRVRGRVSAAG